jgi:hypothetical protein
MTNAERITELQTQLKQAENQYFKIQGAIEVLQGIEMEEQQKLKEEKTDGKTKAKK